MAEEAGPGEPREGSAWPIYGLALVTMPVYYMIPTQIPFVLE